MPHVSVRLHGIFAEFAGVRLAEIEAASVEEALAALVIRHPSLRERLRDEHGRLREHLGLFADGDDVTKHEGARRPLREGATLHIVPAMSGGEGEW